MRWSKLVFASLTMALVVSTAATAQGADPQTGAVAQYEDGTGIESLADLPESLADPAARGTGSLNEAMNDSEFSKKIAETSEVDEVAGITMLPETGGVPPAVPCAGALLVAGGLVLLRSLRR